MNLYARTFSVLKPYWKQLVTASSSAAVHAALSGLMLWMIGPLLMTLFEVGPVPALEQAGIEVHEQVEPGLGGAAASESPLAVSQDWIYGLKDSLKGWIDQAVEGKTVYIVQSISSPQAESLMEMLMLVDAAKSLAK